MQLPWVVVTESVPLRVESVVVNRLALCIAVPGAEADLNRVQLEWARSILGIRGFPQGTWASLLSEVGFQIRLGTVILREAIMLEVPWLP